MTPWLLSLTAGLRPFAWVGGVGIERGLPTPPPTPPGDQGTPTVVRTLLTLGSTINGTMLLNYTKFAKNPTETGPHVLATKVQPASNNHEKLKSKIPCDHVGGWVSKEAS